MFLLKHHSELPSDILIKIESKYTRWFSQLSQEAEQEMHDARRPKELALPLLGSFDAVLHLNILDYDLPEIYGYLLAMFKKLKVMDILKVTPSQMLDFLIDVQERYQDTPYHSFRHGCDVLMMLYSNYMELMRNRAVEGEFDFIMELEIAVIFIAAICHDAGHNGRNNDFHERTKSPLTTRFEKNTSYLEALSVDITLELIEKHRLFHAFTSMEEQCMIHEWIETAILLTDMKHHHDLLKMAKILRDMFDHANLSPKQRLALACVLLHAADISNPIRPWRISKQWSDLVVQEFYAQGDDEREAGFPKISPGMDRMQNTQASTGVRFNNIVKEYFEQVAAILALPSLSSHYNDIDDTQDDPTTTTTKGVNLKHRKMMSLPAGTLSIPSNSNHRKNEPKIRPLPIVRTTSHSSFLFSPP
ncbi:hypothetical protein BDF20DRAFT_956213, partial [Mycotypha africana]|uniref:uncharacterized protein n=1 Tax=Mycotypha africana TaxID=64632 RepID=UPI002301274D